MSIGEEGALLQCPEEFPYFEKFFQNFLSFGKFC